MDSHCVAQLAADTTDPGEGLRAITTLRQLADAWEFRQVTAARRAGMGWGEIAAHLGVTRQAVHKKFARSDRSGDITKTGRQLMGFLEQIRLSQRVSMAADVEREHSGHAAVDLEHLLLALLALGGEVSAALSERGVTLTGAREALLDVERSRLAALGIVTDAPREPVEVSGDVVWSDRAEQVMKHVDFGAGEWGVLAALTAEPSGSIRDLLKHLSVDLDDVIGAGAGAASSPREKSQSGGGVASREVYIEHVAAAPDQVWSIVSLPERFLDWAGAMYDSFEIVPDGEVIATARHLTWSGRRREQPAEPRRLRFAMRIAEPGEAVEWTMSTMSAPWRSWTMRAEVRAMGAGTSVTTRWTSVGERGVVAKLLPWLTRFGARQTSRAIIDRIRRTVASERA